MTDYGQDLMFGAFITPVATPPQQAVDLAVHAERVGLELVTFQDHPYMPRFYDTLTLLSVVAAKTERVRIAGNVLNLPLRPPAILARSAATLDALSGGRYELGLGAGAFWDGIAGMGGRRLSAGESVDALAEGIDIIRDIWDTQSSGPVRREGRFHSVSGARRGPRPAHDIEIWVGAYKPKMLRLVGQRADGSLPSLSYLPDGVASLAGLNATIDDAAEAAGRDPKAIRRLLNIGGSFQENGAGFLAGPPREWAKQLADTTLTYGVSTYILGTDDPMTLEVFAREVAPATRELVGTGRSS